MQDAASAILELIPHDDIALVVKMLSREYEGEKGPERSSGVLAVAVVHRVSSSVWFASRNIGVPRIKSLHCATHAAEKIRRLAERRLDGFPDVSASQSAEPNHPNPDVRTYGGCLVFHLQVQGREIYISFSGAKPEVDEAVVFIIGEHLNFPAPDGYENKLIPRAREIFQGRL